jgi:EmrB/QacA subfamily drug resistance transporter
MTLESRGRAPAGYEPGKFSVLLVASAVSSLIMLDSNIVAVSLPAIARSLGATFTDIEWVVSAYVLTFSALLLGAGSFADRHGRKRATLIGLAIFTVASGICGLATSSLMLNLARALQGVGASLLLTASMAVINQTFSGADRARAYGFWGACLGIAITSGPIAGGLITDLFGWRWAFLLNLPVGIIFLAATAKVFAESRDHEAKRLDLGGIATFSTSLFLLIWGLIDGNSLGWATLAIAWRLVASVVLFAAFIVIELRQERPMIDFTLFKQPTFLGTAFAMLGYAGAAQVMIFYLPLALQNSYGFSPAKAGLAMLPFALPMFFTPRLGASLSTRYSSRALLTLGLATTFVGDLSLFLFSRFDASYAFFAVGMVVLGAGAGLLNSETSKAMQGAVPPQRSGMASGLTSTTRFTGLLLAVAGLGSALSSSATKHFVAAASALGLDPRIAATAAPRIASGDLVGAFGNLPESIRAHVLSAASTSFAAGFGLACLVAAVVAAVTGILTFVLVQGPARAAARDVTTSGQLIQPME